MKHACHDLKRVLDRCVRLPLRSYSIKHVAPWMGFGGAIPSRAPVVGRAVPPGARDGRPAERERLVTALVEYNEDDLWAMRAVWRWLDEHAPKGA